MLEAAEASGEEALMSVREALHTELTGIWEYGQNEDPAAGQSTPGEVEADG